MTAVACLCICRFQKVEAYMHIPRWTFFQNKFKISHSPYAHAKFSNKLQIESVFMVGMNFRKVAKVCRDCLYLKIHCTCKKTKDTYIFWFLLRYIPGTIYRLLWQCTFLEFLITFSTCHLPFGRIFLTCFNNIVEIEHFRQFFLIDCWLPFREKAYFKIISW